MPCSRPPPGRHAAPAGALGNFVRSVTAFGATGDDETDDTDAMRAAANWLSFEPENPARTVELVLNSLAAGWTEGRIVDEYPHITATQIRAAVAFASSRAGRESTLAGFEAAA